MIPVPSFMARGNRLVETIEDLQEVVPILEADRLTWSEEDLVDLAGLDSIHGGENTIPCPRHTAGDLNHIAQIARVMAKQYSNEVGAWRAYLSILSR